MLSQKRWAVFFAAMVWGWVSMAYAADEFSDLKKQIETRFTVKVDSISKSTKIPDFIEVLVGDQVIFVDPAKRLMMLGNILDLQSDRDFSVERRHEVAAQMFKQLPLQNAIKIVKGNGKRVVVTFEDARCGYCKRLVRDLSSLDDVTVYTFLVSVLGEDSTKLGKQIWCSKNKATAWTGWMINGTMPTASPDCGAPLESNLELARKFGMRGTPMLLFPHGEKVPGSLPKDQIVPLLNGKFLPGQGVEIN